MVSLNDINALTLVAKGYMLELAQNMIDDQKKGCMDCADKISLQIQQIILLVEQLYAKIYVEDYGDETKRLYACLLRAVGNYSGASISVDPNSSTPNTTIDVTIITDGRPDWLDVYWGDMTNDVDGYRDTYFNPEWIGLNPMIQIPGVVEYYVDVDYTNDGQGTIVFKSGKGFFEGGTFRAGNYQQYTPPTPSLEKSITVHNVNIPELIIYKNGDYSQGINQGETKVYVANEGDIIEIAMNHNNFTINNVYYGDGEQFLYTVTDDAVLDVYYNNVTVGNYRIVNNSSIDTSYYISSSIPVLAGQTVNGVFTVGQSLIASIETGQKLNFTRYLSNGSIDLALELTNPPSPQLNTSIVDLNKRYEFVYTDNSVITPNAPTNGIVDDNNDTFTFTPAII